MGVSVVWCGGTYSALEATARFTAERKMGVGIGGMERMVEEWARRVALRVGRNMVILSFLLLLSLVVVVVVAWRKAFRPS